MKHRLRLRYSTRRIFFLLNTLPFTGNTNPLCGLYSTTSKSNRSNELHILPVSVTGGRYPRYLYLYLSANDCLIRLPWFVVLHSLSAQLPTSHEVLSFVNIAAYSEFGAVMCLIN
jgi:hypothetical protein